MISSTAGATSSIRQLRMRLWPVLLGVGVVAALGFYVLIVRGPVVSYGDPKLTFFEPRTAAPGAEIKLCFDDIVWFRVCPSVLTTHLTPVSASLIAARAHRLDLPMYTISKPPTSGRVPAKCRPWTVPNLADGEWRLGGHVTSACWGAEIITPMPDVRLEVRR